MDTSANSSQAHSPHPPGKSAGGRQRVIASCLTCRRRKVRCDHVHPICGACARGNHVCTYATDMGSGPAGSTGAGRVSKPSIAGAGKLKGGDVQARLDRLELLLEQAASGKGGVKPWAAVRGDEETGRPDPESQLSPSSNSQSSHGAGLSSDNHDGTLLLDGEQSQFVSSLHYALLAEEVSEAASPY
jgi:hypothetical protein